MKAQEFIKTVATEIESHLDALLPEQLGKPENTLYQAMRHSLLSGGKRLRPVLFSAALKAFDWDYRECLSFVAALEMIHTYSLIHDDLPAMDNDDMRRGHPSCHRAFDEATAILAGDALLTQAFVIFSTTNEKLDPLRQLAATRLIAEYAGLGGMVRGQAAEFFWQGQNPDEQALRDIYRDKTCALFIAATGSAGILAGASELELAALKQYALHLGLAFQIIDDVLDIQGTMEELGKPIGSDIKNNKLTLARLAGCEAAKKAAKEQAGLALLSLESFDEKADMLRDMVGLFVARRN